MMNKEDEIARKIAEFVLNHEQHILDDISDFGLLRDMLEVVKANIGETCEH